MACAAAVRVCPGRGIGTSSAQARRWTAQAFKPWSLRRPQVTILMGLDQHRAQITAEWMDTSTGEISRGRVRPADRTGVRRFVERFRGQQLEVALEATTGWRFVVEKLRAIDARVHLAEPAETAARRGTKRRPKSDRADAAHLRELLMIGRLPESWIPPEHILDLRARVRLRHTLSEQRGEWQQRIQSVLYHHGCPQRGDLMNKDGLAWLAAQPLPACAGEQVAIALAMVDALDTQIAPPTGLQSTARSLWRRPVDVGHDPRRARRSQPLLTLTRSRPLRRTRHHRPPIRSAPRTRTPLPSRTPSTALGALRSRPMRASAHLTRPPVLPRGRGPSRRQPRLPRSRAQAPHAQLPHTAPPRRGRPPTRMTLPVRAKPLTPMRRGRLPACSCRHQPVDGLHRQSGRNASPSGTTPSTIMSPIQPQHPGSRTKIRLGARAHEHPRLPTRNHSPPTNNATAPPTLHSPALAPGPVHSKG